eukprot:Skav235861  [mRNA]  locus=scaffold1693:314522:315025:- [translate_table: standard]
MQDPVLANVTAVDFCRNLFENAQKPKWWVRAAYNVYDSYRQEIFGSNLQRKINGGFKKWSLNISNDICRQALHDRKKDELLKLTPSVRQSFDHICKAECEELVKTMVNNTASIAQAGSYLDGEWDQVCSKRVVQRVESHLLGCCGDSCGWNGKSCALDTLNAHGHHG